MVISIAGAAATVETTSIRPAVMEGVGSGLHLRLVEHMCVGLHVRAVQSMGPDSPGHVDDLFT